MQEGLTFFDIIFLLILGVFIYTRFFSVKLPKGKRGKSGRNKENRKNIVRFPVELEVQIEKTPTKKRQQSITEKVKNASKLEGLDQIKALDPSFKKPSFIKGAKEAYSLLYNAMNDGDEETLDALTSPRIFDELMDKQEEFEAKSTPRKVIVEKFEACDIVDQKIHGQSMMIDVKYNVLQHEEFGGKADKPKLEKVVWTWAKPANSDDPNWELVDIKPIS